MTTFTTTAEQKLKVYKIANQMSESGLSAEFISDIVEFACIYEGAFELIELWSESTDPCYKDELIADLQDEAERYKERKSSAFKAPRINFDDLEKNVNDILVFKKELRSLVDRMGGISKLSKKSGIPQPSLSRFFSTASLPRNTTIYRIVDALLPEKSEYTWTSPIPISQITAMIIDKQNLKHD